MTLVELMVTVSIIALVSSGTAVYAIHQYKIAQTATSATSARTIRAATQHFQIQNKGCPTVTQLLDARVLDRGSETLDPWGGKYFITCPDGDVMVASRGPDRLEWTDDDIVIPDLSHIADPFDDSPEAFQESNLKKGMSVEDWLTRAHGGETTTNPAPAASVAPASE
jgi:type II secretory pathway pseudopilin PulG